MIHIKRTYEAKARADGRRFLVERLWPLGMKKAALHADAWLKDVAPRDEQHNAALVLSEYLGERSGSARARASSAQSASPRRH
jgi:uncharacterized protein YeaO (DUF488 family)